MNPADMPQECEQALAWVCDTLDGGPSVPRERMEAHLAACTRCRAEAAQLAGDDALLHEMGQAQDMLPAQGRFLQRLTPRLQALPVLLPGSVNDRDLTDGELNWLAAAGTPLPSWMVPPADD